MNRLRQKPLRVKQQVGRHRWRIDAHGAKLGHFKNPVMPPDAVGPINDGPTRRQTNQQGHQTNRQQQNKQRDQRQNKIKQSFHFKNPCAARRRPSTMFCKHGLKPFPWFRSSVCFSANPSEPYSSSGGMMTTPCCAQGIEYRSVPMEPSSFLNRQIHSIFTPPFTNAIMPGSVSVHWNVISSSTPE